MIAPCTCKHTFQDSRYGAHMRVFNECEGKGAGKMRCTVCGEVRVVPGKSAAVPVPEKKK